ncbi:SIP domain-containing protein [Frankia sp. CNm7]|uniref:SIP domain-containing protein n=1 Tax=Frankia nepalensis TaxID=1836974 RepID=A0A937RCJ1_9ACTN|nr:SIP domain-containing protein [Frankia nepalensis]MBL7499598.1 SIP domain-containing protein [Frankia nepalensis]MBL7514224.1 SIP domain-containing protein [Frankia nepalensis]MBL7524716.1 SIP domain-containing protein [Frankia nepalensis]MBL7626485.1 SIP domain-containing protein [Frankia nepalensis]
MAKLPKFLADYTERRGFSTEVSEVTDLSAALRRVTFESPSLCAQEFSPCDVTAFRVSDNDFRHYTPEWIDRDKGRASILFHRHHDPKAPGITLVDALRPGNEITWCGVGSAKSFRWTSPAAAVALGDATTVGLMVALAERARAEGRSFLAVLELDAADCSAAQTLLPDAVVLPAKEEPGTALDDWVASATFDDFTPEAIYLAGHGQSIQRQRQALSSRHGLDRKSIRTQPYWATGKVGL